VLFDFEPTSRPVRRPVDMAATKAIHAMRPLSSEYMLAATNKEETVATKIKRTCMALRGVDILRHFHSMSSISLERGSFSTELYLFRA